MTPTTTPSSSTPTTPREVSIGTLAAQRKLQTSSSKVNQFMKNNLPSDASSSYTKAVTDPGKYKPL